MNVDRARRTLLALGGGIVASPSAAWFMKNTIDVSISVTDEQGRAVPHATIWMCVLPRKSPLALDLEDLRRITVRYGDSFDYATPFNTIVPEQMVLPLADTHGRLSYQLDYQFYEGSAARRPAAMSVGFAAMKRGHLPAFADFSITNESRIQTKLVLARDPASPSPLPSYLAEYDRVRFELSDTSRNEEISGSNHERIEGLRGAFLAAADQALAAGDRRAAGRIYARMQFMPVVRFVSGRPAGFAQADRYSEQSWGYLVKAFETAPGDPYVAAERIFRDGALRFGGRLYDPQTATPERRKDFEEFFSEIRRLMVNDGDRIWPTFHYLFALWHSQASDLQQRQQVRPLIEQLYRWEPKFQTLKDLLKLAT